MSNVVLRSAWLGAVACVSWVVTAPPLAPQTEPRVFLPQQAVQRILGHSDPLLQVQVP